jgi:hypothetical protein
MSKNNALTISRIKKGLGIYQVAGGGYGLLLTMQTMALASSESLINPLIGLIITALFGYSILCGANCLTNSKNCLKRSLYNQILQFISFSVVGISYAYVAGLFIQIGIDFSDGYFLTYKMGLSIARIFFREPLVRADMQLNLVAIALVILIDRTISMQKKAAMDIPMDLDSTT